MLVLELTFLSGRKLSMLLLLEALPLLRTL